MLKAIADDNDLSKTTLQHVKSVLSGIFTHAKNEGAFDGANPVQSARIPHNTREPGETYAYNLTQICQILEVLPLLPKAVVATASYAGLRKGELRGLEWPDYSEEALSVSRSIWKEVVNRPKTRASRQSVPVIRQLAEILDAYRSSMGKPTTGIVPAVRGSLWISTNWGSESSVQPSAPLDWDGTAGMASGVASRRICMRWGRTTKWCNAFCVMQSRT
jgi:integrase